MWRGAVRARADLVTITSYNEWHEGTQIEPARSGRRGYESLRGRLGAVRDVRPRPRISIARRTGSNRFIRG